mmetsp:Transcript_32835/g.43289  ORF Transcript_32835/g.43289 Transcript_32835/m.43289 type:complete len:137 (+) Transcript_32835:262-672(+)|eukprot:CAMPEP_0185597960 /NCGR_PEP_ID=MMETSP0434-20130131/81699_1 /TAXON_ID=626734 ORGANISM="Favella taraikaensis, Strain Fe Narragansett Bay" /NCGR_SAMPLE_ID=MMETSP0434 /ASSEMBLY_ACC=CAM_ASM_000379 /LENGTH=136 /DNA_ID=CAMNT_0028226825 /DNA_START=152 /DNA_END=562 /DNA_ORIENTATION=+
MKKQGIASSVDKDSYDRMRDFMWACLSKDRSTSRYVERKVTYRSMIESRGQDYRYRLMDWLLYVSERFKISDEAFLHGFKLAETALTKFQSERSSLAQKARFMLSKPQYCYIVCVYIGAKLHDLTYPSLADYLKVS